MMTDSKSVSGVPSPCKRICQIDMERKYCTACYRTMEEIRNWPILSEEEKQSIVDRIRNDI